MPATFEPIASTTLSAATASVTFSSIPQTFTDLVMIVTGTVGALSNIAWQANGDSGSNYSNTLMLGSGSAATSERGSNLIASPGTVITTGLSVIRLHFMNYSNTTTNKTVLNIGGNAGSYTGVGVGLWRSTAAINSIRILVYNDNSTYQSGCTFSLYGIRAGA
jgi:hypothetical protein